MKTAAWLGALLFLAVLPPAQAAAYNDSDGCRAGYTRTPDIEEKQGNVTIVHKHCVKVACDVFKVQADRDLIAVKRNASFIEPGQEELAEWSRKTFEARNDLIKDSVEFLVGEYAESVMPTREELKSLAHEIEWRKKRLTDPKWLYKADVYQREITKIQTKLDSEVAEVTRKVGTDITLATDKFFETERTARYATLAKIDKSVAEAKSLALEPEFKEFFVKSYEDRREARNDLMVQVAPVVVDNLTKLTKTTRYLMNRFAPEVRAVPFVANVITDVTAAWNANQNNATWRQNMDTLLKATDLVSAQYKKSFDAYRMCKAGTN